MLEMLPDLKRKREGEKKEKNCNWLFKLSTGIQKKSEHFSAIVDIVQKQLLDKSFPQLGTIGPSLG